MFRYFEICYLELVSFLVVFIVYLCFFKIVPSIFVQDNIINGINVKLLVECAHSAKDGVTRNHVFSLISSITKIVPEKVLEHMLDIFAVIGESAVTQVC